MFILDFDLGWVLVWTACYCREEQAVLWRTDDHRRHPAQSNEAHRVRNYDFFLYCLWFLYGDNISIFRHYSGTGDIPSSSPAYIPFSQRASKTDVAASAALKQMKRKGQVWLFLSIVPENATLYFFLIISSPPIRGRLLVRRRALDAGHGRVTRSAQFNRRWRSIKSKDPT